MDTKNKNVLTKRTQIATNAERNPEVSFTSLAYHMNLEWLMEAFYSLRKTGAAGVDGKTAEEYGVDLLENLETLLEEAKSGKYKAPPVRRVEIPKPGSKEKRTLGIPTCGDKVLQKAIKWLIEPVFEQDFYDCSYGFRPGRSQHKAIGALRDGLMEMKGAWVLDLDIRKFFDSIQWSHLKEFLKQRVRDGVIVRLIAKWMNAGVMKEGGVEYPEKGTPQGGVISPLLSNIFLHEVLDKWLHEMVFPKLKGNAFEVRFADDAIICFENKEDALRVMKVLPKRLAKYGLEMHPVKTRLVDFRRPRYGGRSFKQGNRSGTFSFLGFTHYWRKSRKGNTVVGRKTESVRLSRALSTINEWCKKNRHKQLKKQHKKLNAKLRGHYNYYGINSNIESLSKYLYHVTIIWKKWLCKRNRKGKNTWLNWKKMNEKILAIYPLLEPYIKHSNV